MFQRQSSQLRPSRGRANTRARLESLSKRFHPEVVARVVAVIHGQMGTANSYRLAPATITASLQQGALHRGDLPEDDYLPWLAVQFNAVRRWRKRREKRGEPPAENELWQLYQRITDNFSSIVDWARAEHIDLGPLNLDAAIRGARAWHDSFAAVPSRQGGGLVGKILKRWSDGWTVQVLREEQLDRESQILHHCAARMYRRQGRDGKLLSLRDPMNTPVATIELSYDTPPKIEQVKGKRDATPAAWADEDFKIWAPKLVEVLETLQPDHTRWSSEARQLLGEAGAIGMLLNGNFNEAYDMLQRDGDTEAARNVRYVQNMIDSQENETADSAGVDLEHRVEDGKIFLTWTVTFWSLGFHIDQLLTATVTNHTWKKANRVFTRALHEYLPPKKLAALVARAFPLHGYDDDPQKAVIRAIASYTLSGAFRLSTFQLRAQRDGTRKLVRNEYHEVNQNDGGEYALQGVIEWDMPTTVEEWEELEGEAFSELEEYRYLALPDEGAMDQWLDDYLLEARVSEAVTALEAFLPYDIHSPSAAYRALEERGQLILPGMGRPNRKRRASRTSNTRRARLR